MQLVQLPKFGMVSENATVIELVKRIGQRIEIGEHLMTVETEKSAVEVQSSAAGILARYLVEPGDAIPPGTVLAVILANEESLDEARLEAEVAALAPDRKSASGERSAMEPAVVGAGAAAPRSPTIKATPRVRKRAAELAVDLLHVIPTGSGGAITEQDVEAAAQQAARPQGEPLSRSAAATARHMARSWREIPHFHQILEIDAEPLFAARAALGVSLTPFFVKAASVALQHHPDVNCQFDGERLLRLETVDIAVALGDDNSLITPVLRRVDQRTVAEIATELQGLQARARQGQLTPDEAAGGGFTVSNLGMYGIDTGTPIINSPQVALMFVGAAVGRPAFHDGKIAERRFLKITLSYDHRVLSGVPAARFSQEVRELLQRPTDWLGKN